MARYVVRAARTATSHNLSNVAGALIVAGIIISLLYNGRIILEPLVISALLS